MSNIKNEFTAGIALSGLGGLGFMGFSIFWIINAGGNQFNIFTGIFSLLFAIPFIYSAYTDSREGLVCPYFFTIATGLAVIQGIVNGLLFLPEAYSFFGIPIASHALAIVLDCLLALIPVSVFFLAIMVLPFIEKKFPKAIGVGDIKYICAAFFLPLPNEQICIGLVAGLALSAFWCTFILGGKHIRLTPFLLFGLFISYVISPYI